MTEEKAAPVHYQVAVTGRQAAGFFLCLLAALGLSYFFGMKTGAAAKRGLDPISALTAQSDIPVPTAEPEGRGEKPAPEPTESPIGFVAATPEPAREPTAAVPPTPRDTPKPAVREEPLPLEEPKVVELAPPPTVVPTRKAVATAVPAKEPAATKQAAKQGDDLFWVQVLVTSSPEKADGLSKKLKTDGFKPDVALVPGKKALFRVRVGPYPDRAKAEAGAKRVEKLEKLETTIVAPGK
ncbi:MAG: SPOR domain-containing protein [Holophagales bacterium]|nr:SPOR domain-containing protein [Holophagales bacterium]